MCDGYVFEVTLPYSLEIPVGEGIDFVHEEVSGVFTHVERIRMNSPSTVEVSPHFHIPSDSFGLYFRSKIQIFLEDASVRSVWLREGGETRNLFDLTDYVAKRLGWPLCLLPRFVIGAINRVLRLYRILAQEWHAVPLASKDLIGFVAYRKADGVVRWLSTSIDSHRIFSGVNEQFGPDQLQMLRRALGRKGEFAPLYGVEADIHAKAAQGDFTGACILIALMAEVALKDQIIRYLISVRGLSLKEAVAQMSSANGRNMGIADLVDKPKKKAALCYFDELIGWQPFVEKEYGAWKTNTRELRNEIMHGGRTEVDRESAERSWGAAFDLISLARGKLALDLVAKKGRVIDEREFDAFFAPVSPLLFPPKLL